MDPDDDLGRWPSWVYGAGSTPDPRFSMANERGPRGLQTAIALVLVVLGLLGATAAWVRWAATERAMRVRRPLPSTAVLAWFALVLMVVAAALVVLVL